jgi:LysM repeat protein
MIENVTPAVVSPPSPSTASDSSKLAPVSAPAMPSLPNLPPASRAPADATPVNGAPAIDLPPVQGAPPGTSLAAPKNATPYPAATTAAPTLPPPFPTTPTQDASGATTVTTPTISGRVPAFGAPQSAPAVGPPGFAAAWQAVGMALERDELTRAHRMLSQWRAEPNLTAADRAQVEALLNQLAGTVVYSTEHRLEPPRVVAPGETLEKIATEYNVPWQLLAKINGVASPEAVQPGQTLKVIRGPFTAEVDLAAGNLVLLLDERYAGRFPVRVEGASPSGGEWRVAQKRLEPAGQPLMAPGPKVVLEGPTGEQLELGDATTPATGAGGRLTVASNDLADLYDILSVGSSVTVRR